MGLDLLSLFVFVWGGVDEETQEDAAPRLSSLNVSCCSSGPRRSRCLLWGLCFHRIVRTVRTTFSCFSPRRVVIDVVKLPMREQHPRKGLLSSRADRLGEAFVLSPL